MAIFQKTRLQLFIDQVARELGEGDIGLIWAPALTVADYGAWGGYVRGAPTLGAALIRAQSVMPYHSSMDKTNFRIHSNLVGYEYKFGLKKHVAYPNIAFSAIGAVLSIFYHFLGSSWRPRQIFCDLPRLQPHEEAEATFGCPVLWNKDRLEIWFERSALSVVSPHQVTKRVTLEDIKRERVIGPPASFPEIVSRVLQLQIALGGIDLNAAARSLDIGPRSLQRRLQSEGVNFRTLANRAKTARAVELLNEGSLSVQEIATDLGYENSQNFSRAFRRSLGLPPSAYVLR
ncbi:AraC family transcriptional regulator [Roseibium sp. RKSG952]|uniref:helix-turn-helix domain-containing protein n=1 Tax=Roseibium sp. RKSG952 TaxID=2529384 RepID=UPI0012BD828A|nr:AraC family transcriptional regulator [Roseibium sp. RKSG952]MTI02192.1 AraC family transcriptional regulator [Roseibium sp. RKSG952]